MLDEAASAKEQAASNSQGAEQLPHFIHYKVSLYAVGLLSIQRTHIIIQKISIWKRVDLDTNLKCEVGIYTQKFNSR